MEVIFVLMRRVLLAFTGQELEVLEALLYSGWSQLSKNYPMSWQILKCLVGDSHKWGQKEPPPNTVWPKLRLYFNIKYFWHSFNIQFTFSINANTNQRKVV